MVIAASDDPFREKTVSLTARVLQLRSQWRRTTAQARNTSRHMGLEESALRRGVSLALKAQESVNSPAGH